MTYCFDLAAGQLPPDTENIAYCSLHLLHDTGCKFAAYFCCRGQKGLAYSDALDKSSEYPALPEYGTAEYDSTNLGRLHASMPALLSSASQPEPSTAPAAETVRSLCAHAAQ